jgi:hypothetical protein
MYRLPGFALNFVPSPPVSPEVSPVVGNRYRAGYLLSGEYSPFSQVIGSNARYHLAGLF